MKMRYFSSVQGLAFQRPGRPGTFIGCKRKPRDKATGVSPGFVWNTDAVIAVTGEECARNLKDYNDAARDGVLIEKSEEDFKKLDDVVKAKEVAQAEAAKKAAETAEKAAKKAAKAANKPSTEED